MKTLRTEFEALKSELLNGNTYDSSGNDSYPWISKLLDNLEAKIFEYENRMICAIKTSDEIRKSIQKFTSKVDEGEPFIMSVDDHDVILRGANDIDIALDTQDDTAVTDDWYGLFIGRKNKEVLYTFMSSLGEIDCNKDGYVVAVRGENSMLHSIDRFNLSEYKHFLVSNNITSGECDDILAVGYFTKDGGYTKPDSEFRNHSINKPMADDLVVLERGEKIENDLVVLERGAKLEVAPTYQCMDNNTFDKVKDVIATLKSLHNGDGVDGETMEYILEQLGMTDQMLRQLIMNNPESDTVDLLTEKRELNNKKVGV